jgi:MFS family permease
VFYIGVGLGAVCSGIIANKLGRLPSLLIGIFFQVISGFVLALNLTFGWFCLFRMFYGVGFGATLVVATTLAT